MTNSKLYILIGILGVVIGVLLISFPAPHDRILNIQNYLITVGGIISAFAIAYLSSKIFNLRSERANRKLEIDKYADLVTKFRRLLYFVMKSRNFWTYFDHVRDFKQKYPGLDYKRLHGQADDDQMRMDFWLKEEQLSSSTVDLYMAMEAIAGAVEPEPGYLATWHIDKAVRFDYTPAQISDFIDPSNQIWYYLDGRFEKHGKGKFNDTGISTWNEGEVRDLIATLSPKNNGDDFHRKILADIAAEMHGFTLPKLYSLTLLNVGVPRPLLRTFFSLLFIMCSGVLLPILLQSLQVADAVDTFLTLTFVWLTSIALLVFMADFYNFLQEEVHLTGNRG